MPRRRLEGVDAGLGDGEVAVRGVVERDHNLSVGAEDGLAFHGFLL
jgi:hypothetical protein